MNQLYNKYKRPQTFCIPIVRSLSKMKILSIVTQPHAVPPLRPLFILSRSVQKGTKKGTNAHIKQKQQLYLSVSFSQCQYRVSPLVNLHLTLTLRSNCWMKLIDKMLHNFVHKILYTIFEWNNPLSWRSQRCFSAFCILIPPDWGDFWYSIIADVEFLYTNSQFSTNESLVFLCKLVELKSTMQRTFETQEHTIINVVFV